MLANSFVIIVIDEDYFCYPKQFFEKRHLAILLIGKGIPDKNLASLRFFLE
jgi:hypothetical protein